MCLRRYSSSTGECIIHSIVVWGCHAINAPDVNQKEAERKVRRWGVSFQLTNRKSCGHATPLDAAKAAFKMEHLAWMGTEKGSAGWVR
jgi:hypothetical protein